MALEIDGVRVNLKDLNGENDQGYRMCVYPNGNWCLTKDGEVLIATGSKVVAERKVDVKEVGFQRETGRAPFF